MSHLGNWDLVLIAGLVALFVWLLLTDGVVVAIGVTVLVMLGLLVAGVILEFSKIWFNGPYGSDDNG